MTDDDTDTGDAGVEAQVRVAREVLRQLDEDDVDDPEGEDE